MDNELFSCVHIEVVANGYKLLEYPRMLRLHEMAAVSAKEYVFATFAELTTFLKDRLEKPAE